MKLAIYGKPYRNKLNSQFDELASIAEKAGFEPALYKRYADFLKKSGYLHKEYPTFDRDKVQIDQYHCLISVGGDGTLLDTVTLIGTSGVPVIGVNAGRLGFISSLTLEELADLLAEVRNGTYHTESRSLLRVVSDRGLFGDQNYALNELTIHKKDTASMIKIEAYLNGELLNAYWSDGLIVSTPTGSTAYSLSCGGPIIVPGSENVVVTPIAPHNLTVRPVVVANNAQLTLKTFGRSEHFLIALDSRTENLLPGEAITIDRAPFTFNLLQPKSQTFLSTLRNKLAWGLDKRN